MNIQALACVEYVVRAILFSLLTLISCILCGANRVHAIGPSLKGATMEMATLGGGCFWCIEATLRRLKGVQSVTSGYAGGAIDNPSYEAVSNGDTGHAEVVQIEFDPTIISFSTLLEVFFHLHDPTTLNRQGNDVGTQYRSVIFYHSAEQASAARAVMKKVTNDKLWDAPLVTELKPFTNFFPAEAYHQNYYDNNKSQPYCSFVIAPKIKKLQHEFSQLLKSPT